MTLGLFTRLLHFLASDRAKRRWGRWKGVRNLIAYAIWFFRFSPAASRRVKPSGPPPA